MELITGFSRLTKKEKINWLTEQVRKFENMDLSSFEHSDEKFQKLFENFSENTITNYHMPYGVAPNFIINNQAKTIPMVIEESSVVAAVSKAAKFWSSRGGFKASILSFEKVGHVYFYWPKDKEVVFSFFKEAKEIVLNSTISLVTNMEKRGGGIIDLELQEIDSVLIDHYKLELSVDTCDAMGANFINTLLEKIAEQFEDLVKQKFGLDENFEIIMSILSNYTPKCIVRSEVCCPISQLGSVEGVSSLKFANKFKKAIDIASVDRDRAVTHNKGIMNGVDAVILATGNDFRSVEACAHAYACRDGHYQSLTKLSLDDGAFHFTLDLPLSVGTIGGLTNLHPLAKLSLDILGNPSSKELMKVVASVGLAQNFAAVKSLVTTGIQKGHMKMHLLNILCQLGASEAEKEGAKGYFRDKVVTYTEVRNFLQK